jgi:hypothetical protein
MAQDQAVVNAVSANETSPSQTVSNDVSNNVPRETSEVKTSVAEPEKMLPQSKVNELVGRTRQEERERVKREYESKIISQPTEQNQNFGGVTQLSEERVRQLYREEEKQKELVNKLQTGASELISKIKTGKEKYQDFDEVTKHLKLDELSIDSPFVHYVNEFDNAADMIYEFGKNPEKLGSVVLLFNDYNLTRIALKKLSDSIKSNELATKQPKANSPLSQISSSPTGVDNGKQTIADLRKQTWLKA